jgi:hypothetical protein
MYLIKLPKDDLKWLQKALNKKDVRTFCNQILVKNGLAYATNGHVIHRVATTEDQEGLYTREGIKIEEELRHPLVNNSDKVLQGYDYPTVLVLMSGCLGTLKLSGTIGINHIYFNNAVDRAKEIELLTNEYGVAIRVDYNNRTAVIMGCKITEGA